MANLASRMSRAIRQLRSHPAVHLVRAGAGNDATEVIVDLLVGLPSRWEAAGQSPNGVRAVESVTIRFTANYPLGAPRVFLRPDFNRAHPHLQPGHSTELPEPCLVMGSPAELLAARGINGFVDQLLLWLQRAAQVELINPQQGWEPIRRDQLDHILVADAEILRSKPTREAGSCVFTSFYHTQNIANARYHSLIAFRDERRPAYPRTLLRDLTEGDFPLSLTIAVWSGKNPDGSPFIAGSYRPDTVSNVSELYGYAQEIGCGGPLTSALSSLQSALRHGSLTVPIPIAIVLLASRPVPLIGEDSNWEIIPYLIEVSGQDDLSARSAKSVVPAIHRHAISAPLLARMNGVARPAMPQWTLIGCGSVGSKIALHLARAGLAPADVVDKATMAPHNYARHGLLVQTVAEEMIPLSKAHLLARALKALGQDATAHQIDVLSRLNELPDAALSASHSAMIINATGTLSAREALAAQSRPGRAPIVETFLLAEGRIGYLAVEGPGANPSAADLAVEAYRLIAQDPALSDVAFQSEPQAISIGQGCASVTMNVTDASLSALSAAVTTQIQRWLVGGFPVDGGRVLVGSIADDGMSQTWQHHAIQPWSIIPAKCKSISVRLSPHARAKIEAQVAQNAGVETGGVLIGRWSEAVSAFYVADVLSAPSDSYLSKDLFILGIDGLKEKIADIIGRTDGALYALGTWHNHLVDSGPSRVDRQTAHLLAKAQHHPALLLIHTPSRYRVLIAEAFDRSGTIVPQTLGDQAHDPD